MKPNNKYEILTPEGWKDFAGVAYTGKKKTDTLYLSDGSSVTATPEHKFIKDGLPVTTNTLRTGDYLDTSDGSVSITDIAHNVDLNDCYDIVDVQHQSHQYLIENSLKSHNCDELAFVSKRIAINFWTSVFPTLSCLTGDTWVLSDKGYRQIKEYFTDDHKAGDYFLMDGEKTWGKNGIEDISHGYVSPASKTFIIETRTGHRLEVTEDHPLFTLTDHQGSMVKARDLRVGDYLRTDIGMNVFGNGSINANDSYMMGMYIAEGWMVKNHKRTDTYQMWVSNGDQEIHDFFIDNYGFNGPYNNYKLCTGKSETIGKFLEYGLNPELKCYHKQVPQSVMQGDKLTVVNFLAGLYDGDGSITERGIVLSSTSFEQIQQVKLLLNNLGFVSRLSKTNPEKLLEIEQRNGRMLPQGKVTQSLRQSYNLTISNTYAKKFFETIPLKLTRKKEKLVEYSLSTDQDSFKQTKYPAEHVREHVIQKLKESGFTGKHCRDNGLRCEKIKTCKNFTYSWIETAKSIGIDLDIETGGFVWDDIVSIEESYQEVTYDFTVPVTHSFLQNGVLGSNTGGSCIITSTPTDDETLFADIWKKANDCLDEFGNTTDIGSNGFKSIKVKWDEHPERDDSFKELMIKQFGEEKFRREHELDFIAEDETLISPLVLSELKSKAPIQKTGEVRWYKELDREKIYLIGYDPSLGTGGDNSAIQVFEFPSMEQVGEWMHNKSDVPTQLNVLKKILGLFEKAGFDEDNVRWTLENNSVGEAPLVLIDEYGEDEFFGYFMSEPYNHLDRSRRKRFRKGYNTNASTKLTACTRMKRWIDSGTMTINSRPLIKELKGFVSRGRTYKARAGDNDDLVMAMLLVVRMAMASMDEEDEFMDVLGVTRDMDDEDDLDDWDQPLPVIF